MILQLFWVAATVEIIMAIAFALQVRRKSVVRGSPLHIRLAEGQRKDDWLACAAVWAGIFHDDVGMEESLLLLGCVVLAWLARRAADRVRQLQRCQG